MLIRREASVLLLVDLQERLLPRIHGGESVLGHAVWLARLARRLDVPIVVTEQYPQGLGPTVPALRRLLHDHEVVAKVHFSAVADGCLQGLETWSRPQVVVAGTEAHVCVLQTAIGLLQAGKQVYVVSEATASRDPVNHALALQRLRGCGAEIVSREMVAFEWLGRAGTDTFRAINRDFIR